MKDKELKLEVTLESGMGCRIYESIKLKRELKKRRKNEDRCDERLKPKGEESTRLVYTRCCLF